MRLERRRTGREQDKTRRDEDMKDMQSDVEHRRDELRWDETKWGKLSIEKLRRDNTKQDQHSLHESEPVGNTVKNVKLRKLQSWRQPASEDYWVFSHFCCTNWKQQSWENSKISWSWLPSTFKFSQRKRQSETEQESSCLRQREWLAVF